MRNEECVQWLTAAVSGEVAALQNKDGSIESSIVLRETLKKLLNALTSKCETQKYDTN